MTTGKTIALTRQTFVNNVMSLLFNMLSRLVITFLPRSKCLLISWLQSPSAVILEPPKNEAWHCFYCLPIYLPWSDGTRCHDLSFPNVELYAQWKKASHKRLHIVLLLLYEISVIDKSVETENRSGSGVIAGEKGEWLLWGMGFEGKLMKNSKIDLGHGCTTL